MIIITDKEENEGNKVANGSKMLYSQKTLFMTEKDCYNLYLPDAICGLSVDLVLIPDSMPEDFKDSENYKTLEGLITRSKNGRIETYKK